MVQDFFAKTKASLVEQWQATQPDDKEAREIAYHFLILTNMFERYLHSFLAGEEYAKFELEQLMSGVKV